MGKFLRVINLITLGLITLAVLFISGSILLSNLSWLLEYINIENPSTYVLGISLLSSFFFLLVLLLFVVYLIIFLIFFFKKRKENKFIKISYWINIITPILIILSWMIILFLSGDVGGEESAVIGAAITITTLFITGIIYLISFVLFLIGFFKSRKESKTNPN